jgi:hypothetical protein
MYHGVYLGCGRSGWPLNKKPLMLVKSATSGFQFWNRLDAWLPPTHSIWCVAEGSHLWPYCCSNHQQFQLWCTDYDFSGRCTCPTAAMHANQAHDTCEINSNCLYALMWSHCKIRDTGSRKTAESFARILLGRLTCRNCWQYRHKHWRFWS